MEPRCIQTVSPAKRGRAQRRSTVGVELYVEHGLADASPVGHDVPCTVGNFQPSDEVIGLRGFRRVNRGGVGSHQQRHVFREIERANHDFISVHNTVLIGVVEPRLPQVEVGMGWEMRAVSHGEGERCSGSDVPTVKFLDGAAHQRGWNIVKQEGERTGKRTDHALSSERNHLNPNRHRRSPCWNRVGEQGDTVLEQCRSRIFVAVDEEPNEGLSRSRLTFGGVLKTQFHFEVDHFTGP